MTKLIRKLVLGTASVLALAIAGTALDHAANAGNAANFASIPSALQASESSPTGDFLRKDDIRWAQVELRDLGLYNGSLDGVLGPETKRALARFQESNNLGRTASLDAQTWESLTNNREIGQGSSSLSLDSHRVGSAANSSPASDLGK